MSISTTLQSQLADSKVLTKSTITIGVSLQTSSLMKELAKQLHSELNRMAPYAGYSDVADLAQEDIEKYLDTLVWLRTAYCNSVVDKSYAQYKAAAGILAVPVLAYQCLIAIGIAYDNDFNLRFVPAYEADGDRILSVEEMLALSDIFRRFEQDGLKVVYGLPKKKDGELDFMAMCHVGDEVLSYRRCHPVYGFLAAFFTQKTLNEITGSMCRVIYGYETDYKYQVSALMNCISGADL